MAILLKNLTVGEAREVDVLVDGGAIAALGPALIADGAEVLDCGGALLLPSFVDAHVHLDKTRWGAPRLHHPVTASVPERAGRERRLRVELQHDPFAFGCALVRQLSVMGTTHVRSHVDIDPDVGLRHVEAMLRLRERFRGLFDIELVAFPQSGVARAPGVLALMTEAMRLGVDVVGGLDPQAIDGDRAGQLDALFALAQRTGAPIDIHLHEPGAVGLATIAAIVERTRAHAMQGRVTISHGYALGQVAPAERDPVLAELAELRIAVVTTAPGAIAFPSVDALLDAGVVYAGVSDGIRDLWTPWGSGDLLERAMLLAWRSGYRADEPLRRCFEMVTREPAKLLGLPRHGLGELGVGTPANLTAVHADDVASAVLQRPARLFTLKDGRFIARGGASLLPQ
jgi:cytosine/creatinine deaminase